MNVPLPFQESNFAFALIMGISVLISLILVLVFIHKKYF